MTLNQVISDLQKLVELNPLSGEMQVVVLNHDKPYLYNQETTDTVATAHFYDNQSKSYKMLDLCVVIG